MKSIKAKTTDNKKHRKQQPSLTPSCMSFVPKTNSITQASSPRISFPKGVPSFVRSFLGPTFFSSTSYDRGFQWTPKSSILFIFSLLASSVLDWTVTSQVHSSIHWFISSIQSSIYSDEKRNRIVHNNKATNRNNNKNRNANNKTFDFNINNNNNYNNNLYYLILCMSRIVCV